MGRPRKVFSQSFRVVTDLDRTAWEELQKVCQSENVSVRKLLRSLVESYAESPVYVLQYVDPLVMERVSNPNAYSVARRECIGWLVANSDDAVTIRFDRPLEPVPDGKEPAGASYYKIPKACVIGLRRTTP